MKVPREHEAVEQVIAVLKDFVGEAPSKTRVCREPRNGGVDAIVEVGAFSFLVEWRRLGTVVSIAGAVEQVLNYSKTYGNKAIPVVAVPFMGPAGRERCREAGVSWFDLSGNADISAPGLRIQVQGRPNKYKNRGRPSSAFAPKSARISRWFLIHPEREVSQRELSSATNMSEGFTSKIVAKLADDRLVVRTARKRIRVKDPNLLLDAWAEQYRFDRHRLIQGHIPARSSDALLTTLSGELGKRSIRYAATGLSAAWLLTHFVAYRMVTVYLEKETLVSGIEKLGFREEDRGANTWLVIPNDEGVFQGSKIHNGVKCVHPVQVYLDLLGHPERASDAAASVRSEYLNWGDHD